MTDSNRSGDASAPGYSAEGVRPSGAPPQVVTPDWARALADSRQPHPTPPPQRRRPRRRREEPPAAETPPSAAQLRWRSVEFPVVLIIVLGLVVSLGLISHRAGSAGDTFPHNSATRLWPADGTARDVAYTVEGATHPGTSENARFLGFVALTAIPAPMVAALHRPEGDVESAHFWRQTDVRFTELDRRVQFRRGTDRGTELYAVTWGDRGAFFGPPLLEVPADVTAGATWESTGEAGVQSDRGRVAEAYHDTSTATTPQDASLADQGCLTITSQTTVGSVELAREAVWCPNEGVVQESGSWDGDEYALMPAGPTPVSDQVRQSDPLPEVTGPDPAQWPTGWIEPPVEEDEVFGVGEPVLVPTDDPVISGLGWISVDNQVTGDVMTFEVATSDTADYPAGSPLLQWRAGPGGEITAIGTHGALVTVTTVDGLLSVIGGNGGRRWTVTLPEVAVTAPVSLGSDRMAVATLDGQVQVLDVGTGETVWRTTASEQGISLPLATDGRTIAAVDADYTLILIDAATGELTGDETTIGQPVNGLQVVDGMVVVAAGRVAGIDARTGSARWRTEMSVPGQVATSGDRVAVLSPHETRILLAQTGQEQRTLPAADAVVGVTGGFAMLIDGEVWVTDQDGTVRHRWSLEGLPADALSVGGGRIWAFDKDTMTGWWVEP